MKSREARLAQSLRAAQRFIADNAHRIPGVAHSGARSRLDELLRNVATHADMQAAGDTSGRMATRTRHAMRAALLRDHILPIVRIAAAESHALPDMSVLRLPPRHATPERLHAYAAGMAEAAARSAHVFTAAGLPADFVERLTQAADAMLAAVDAQTSRRLERGEATAGVRVTIAAARRMIGVLDAMVTSEIHGDVPLLRAWKSAIHPERARRRAPAAIAALPPGVALVAIAASTAPAEAQPALLPAAEHPVRRLGDGLVGVLVRMLPRARSWSR